MSTVLDELVKLLALERIEANLFRGQRGKKSIIERHQNRVDWVTEHLTDVLSWLDQDTSSEWNVEAFIVVDRELFTPHLEDSPMPVIPIHVLISSLS